MVKGQIELAKKMGYKENKTAHLMSDHKILEIN